MNKNLSFIKEVGNNWVDGNFKYKITITEYSKSLDDKWKCFNGTNDINKLKLEPNATYIVANFSNEEKDLRYFFFEITNKKNKVVERFVDTCLLASNFLRDYPKFINSKYTIKCVNLND